jgi:ribosomal-protein-alanine N-acetyltransferase
METPRLILRKLTLNDAAAMFEYASARIVTKYLWWKPHKSSRDSRKRIRRAIEGRLTWGIVLKEENKLIGDIAFTRFEPWHNTAKFGYVLSPRYWNRGLATEAVKAIVKFGFTRLGLQKIYARCWAENRASARVLEKGGLQLEGTLRQDTFCRGKWHDIKVYSSLRNEFNKRRSYYSPIRMIKPRSR